MKCPKCQHENEEGKKFCVKCGTRLELRCPKCGSAYKEEDNFCGECGQSFIPVPAAPKPQTSPPKLEEMQAQLQNFISQSLAEKMKIAQQNITGENRLVTALFADISGFSAMSQKLPTEVVVKKINQCFKAIVDTVYRYEGNINRFIGDCALALFGAPIVHENDPERAILAALDIQKEAAKLELNISIGINSGNMYFGPIGTQEHLEISAYGPDIILAKRLQEAAGGGRILVGDGSYRHTKRAFDFKRVESLNLKGIGEGIVAYEALNVKSQPERIRGLEGLRAPLIGREREIEKLRTCIDELLNGRGQIVSITGEAGIGKSRLVSELREQVGDRLIWLEGRCVSYGQSMNYSPFRGIIGSYLGILPTDTEEESKAKLHEKVNALLPATHRWIPIHVGHIFFPQYEQQLRVASGDNFAKQGTYPIMRDLFQKIAAEKPLVLVFEDMHWADPSSLALLEYLMASVDDAPILYCWVYRPIRDSECWRLRERAARDFAYCNSEIDLSPLRHEETETLVCELLKIPDIPERMRNLICGKALGNPLYVEEIIHSFIDEEAVVKDGEYWRAKLESVEIVAVPSETLQGVILARVDQLEGEVKEVLQIASVLGDSFPLSLLEKVSESTQNLSHSLRTLEHAELLQRRRIGSDSDWEYRFRHPLIHDVVYQSLLLETRATLHEKTGLAIEELYSDKLDNYTDLLAYHYGRGSNVEKALHYLTLAGDKAAKLASYWEALDYYGMAMKKAEDLPDELRKKRLVVDLVMKRSFARHMLGLLRQDVEELEKYVEWAEEIGDRDKIDFFYFYLIFHSYSMEEIAQAEQYHKRYASLVVDPWKSVWIIFAQVNGHLFKADYETAAVLAQHGAEAATKTNEARRFFSLSFQKLAKAYSMMGRWNESLEASQTNLEVAIELSDSTCILQGRAVLGSIYLSMGEWEKTIAECETALNMSPSHLSIPRTVTPLGDAYCKTGQLDKGIALLEHWKAYAKRTGRGPIVECEYCLPLAEGYLSQGNRAKAQANAEEALQIAQTKGYPLHEAQAHRILGEILAETDFPAAEDHFSRSLEIMQRIKAKNEEGKTELSWGRACHKYGDLAKARVHLTCAEKIFEALGTTRYLEWTKEALANLE